MLGHMIDHFIFTARRLSEMTKNIAFALLSAAVVGVAWWFRGVAFGIDGPIGDHWGLGWRKVRCLYSIINLEDTDDLFFTLYRVGISTNSLYPAMLVIMVLLHGTQMLERKQNPYCKA